MIDIVLIRHGPTAWNEAGRIQGRVDVPLTAAARAALERRRLPRPWCGYAWAASPLARARETALALGAGAVAAEPRLVEMRWGEWEGETLAGLRRRLGEQMRRNEDRGLDFRPPGGESPREVMDRLLDWAGERAALGTPVVAVTHKGVIRAALAAATGWDMLARAPVRLDWARAQRFGIAGATLRVLEANVSLEVGP